MRLSVIIPLYNCEAVIERCLESIDHLDDMEVIVVNDGSTDSGVTVVERYAATHPRYELSAKKTEEPRRREMSVLTMPLATT